MKKIVSIALALAVAMALTVSACAATYDGSLVINAKGWWAQVGSDTVDFFGEIGIENAESITFSCADHNIIVCYNNTEGAWTQSEGVAEYTIDMSDVGTGEGFYICVVISDDNGVDYTVNWTVTGKEASAEEPADDTPAVEETPEEDAPAAEEPETEAPAETGVALTLVPVAAAMTALAITKRR